jgi:adenylate kinase
VGAEVEAVTTVLILLGAPGSGKGTQAIRLADVVGLPHVSTGDLFRDNVGKGTELGVLAKGYMDRGELVPDHVVLDMLFARVAAGDCADGYVLDGFPRTVPQADALEQRLDPDVTLAAAVLEVSDDEIRRRAAGRGRNDDEPEVVTKRISVYREQTAPLIEFYADRGVLHEIDGERSPDAVFADLLACVKSLEEAS